MPDRVAFRGRARGCVVSKDVGTIKAVSIGEPRVKFVKGWIDSDPGGGAVKCGGGTAYPMLVTLAQLEAIYYRVWDAKFISGSFTIKIPESVEGEFTNQTVGITAGTPASSLFSTGAYGAGTYYMARGYCTFAAGSEVPMEDYDSSFLGAPYAVGGSGTNVGSATVRDAVSEKSLSMNGPTARDQFADPVIISTELGCFDTNHYPYDSATVMPYFDLSFVVSDFHVNGGPFKTGFSLMYESTYSSTKGSLPYGAYESSVSDGYPELFTGNGESGLALVFGSTVAFIDDAESGDPYDPGNRLYAAVEFAIVGNNGFFNPSLSTLGTIAAGVNLILDFGSSGIPQCSAPLYRVGEAGFDFSGTDFVIQADGYWPYKTAAGAAAWDASTGLPANGGPGA